MHKMLTLSRYELNNCLPSAEPLEVRQEQAYNSGRLLVAVSALLSLRFPFPLGRSHFLGSLVKNGYSEMDVKYTGDLGNPGGFPGSVFLVFFCLF